MTATLAINRLRSRINDVLAEHTLAAKQVVSERQKLKETRRKVAVALEGQKVVQAICLAMQESIHQQIAGVVTRCIQSIFPEKYTFELRFEKKRGKTEARPLFLDKDGHEIHPIKGSGKGKADIAALALRIACLMLSRPKKRRLIVLDEPFLGTWRGYRDLVRELIEQLSKELNIQFILVTQEESFQVGKVIQL